MKILVATDKFKHSLTTGEACAAIKAGLLRAGTSFTIDLLPIADGGDGLSDVILQHLNCSKVSTTVLDPLFRSINSSFLLSSNKKTAYIEMAKASGLALLRKDEFGCSKTSSVGTGQLIRKAMETGVEKI